MEERASKSTGRLLAYFGLLMTIGAALQGCAPAGKERPGGYLTRFAPAPLRFAPPRPLAVNLPKLPNSPDPIMIPAELTAPVADQPMLARNNISPPQTGAAPPSPAPRPEPATSQPTRTPAVTVESTLVSPQLLIRLFPTVAGGAPSVEMQINDALPFQPPSPSASSSAVYEVK